jgi:RNA polymerase sigma-70 factor (ECF subfamily)
MTAASAPRNDDATGYTGRDKESGPSAAVLRAARDGDQAAFAQVMLATEGRLARLAWRILGDRCEVEEAMQETFLRLFRSFARYDERHDFAAWLYRIAVNVCRDLERRRRRRRIFMPLREALGLASPEPSAHEQLGRHREVALLERLIDELPPRERLAILLRDVEELSSEQAAVILGSSPATVRVQVRRARLKLRQRLALERGAGR